MPINRRSFVTTAISIPLLHHGTHGVMAQVGTQGASPESMNLGPASHRLQGLLSITPSSPVTEILDVLWTDHQRQFGAYADIDPERPEMYFPSGSIYDPVRFYDQTQEITGFKFMDIQQFLIAGRVPHTVRLLQLGLDARALPPLWEDYGFVLLDRGFGQFWSIGEGGEQDLTSDLQRVVISAFNNIAILDDNLIALAPTADLLRDAVETYQNQPSDIVSELDLLAAGVLEDAISAWFLGGEVLHAPEPLHAGDYISLALANSDDAVGPMPQIRALATGVSEGSAFHEDFHQPDSRMYLLLESAHPGGAEDIAAVVAWRMENLQGLRSRATPTELLGSYTVEALSENIVRVVAEGSGNPNMTFANMIFSRDILPFAFVPER